MHNVSHNRIEAGSRRSWSFRRGAWALGLLGALGCGGGVPDDVIEREVFVQAYVDLRLAALETDSQRIAAVERDEILARHGVSGDDLMRFADVHAEDLDFMRAVWNEVELQLDREPEVAN